MSRKSLWAIALLLTAPLLRPAAAAPSPSSAEALQPLATLSASGIAVDWQPRLSDYDRLILTVAGPKGLVIRREFEAGKNPSLNLTDKAGRAWPDGDYSYELRLVPRVDERLRQEIRRAREAGNDAQVEKLVNSSGLRASQVQSGALMIRNGALVVSENAAEPQAEAGSAASTPPSREGALERTVIIPPLIVAGGACIGESCSGADNPSSVWFKGDLLNLLFIDTFGGVTGDRDWALATNEIGNGNRFVIRDNDASTRPFTIEEDSPETALYIRNNGNLGLGAFPLKDVHMVNPSSPTIRLEQTFGALPARTWDLVGNDIGFSIQDITGAKTPLRVRAAAPTGAVEVAADGSIGLGTTTPANRLHLFGSAGTTKMLIQEASGSTNFRELLELRNNGGTMMIFKDSSLAQRWSAGTFGSSFILDEQAHAGIEFIITPTGNLTVLGTVTPGSSREIKHGFAPVDQRTVLDRVVALPITSWEYNADQNVRHIGPMAEDFYSAFQVGADNKGISVTDSAGVALAAIQGLYSLVAEKDAKLAQVARENADLAQRNRDLDERLTRLEARLSALGGSPAPAIPVQ